MSYKIAMLYSQAMNMFSLCDVNITAVCNESPKSLVIRSKFSATKLASQEVADPSSDQIRTGSARPAAGNAEPHRDHGHDVHGNSGKDTYNHANNERTASHRTAPTRLLVRLLPNKNSLVICLYF